jgi:MFS superfamily sulfate permease-like transporter
MKIAPVSFKQWRADLPAGLVVFLVALPLCLGIALASEAPLFSGIIAGIIGGIVIGYFSGSDLSVSGPAAGLTAIVAAAITELGSFEVFLVAVVLSGLFQIALGMLKAGVIGYYFPSSVIKGMLSGIGLLLILKQIPHALGIDQDAFGDEEFFQLDGENTFTEIAKAITHISPGALVIALVSMGLLLLWDRPFIKKLGFTRIIPGALVVVVLGAVMNLLFGWWIPAWKLDARHLVELPSLRTASDWAMAFQFPDFGALITHPGLILTAATIAVVASMESLLSLEATDKLDPYKRSSPANQELIAQGIGNTLSGLIGGLPMTAVIVRSSANVQAGGRTRLSALVHGFMLLISVLLIPGLLNLIPYASLAAILLLVGYKLSSVKQIIAMYRLGWDQFLPYVVTILGIVFTDLLKGIALGMVVAVFYILRGNYRTPYFFHRETHPTGERIVLELAQEVSFLNKASVLLTLQHLPDNSTVLIDCTKTREMDYDVREIIWDFAETAKLKNIRLEIKGVEKPQKSASAH